MKTKGVNFLYFSRGGRVADEEARLAFTQCANLTVGLITNPQVMPFECSASL